MNEQAEKVPVDFRKNQLIVTCAFRSLTESEKDELAGLLLADTEATNG